MTLSVILKVPFSQVCIFYIISPREIKQEAEAFGISEEKHPKR